MDVIAESFLNKPIILTHWERDNYSNSLVKCGLLTLGAHAQRGLQ